MRVKVLKPFKDKYTGTIHQKGHEIDVTEERFEELSSAALGPFVEQAKENVQSKAEAPKKSKTKKTTK